MSKLRHRLLSYLLFVVVVALVVSSARFQWMQNSLLNRAGLFIGGYLANIAQAVTAGSRNNPHGGDLIALVMFFLMLIDLITRHSNRFYWFQHWAATHLSLSPTNMITFSFGISLSYRNNLDAGDNQYPPIYVQLLILIIFTTAMYSLFSAADPPEYSELSVTYRLTSRVMEYSLYICFFPKYPAIWCWQIMAPLGLIICISRSNQIFRLWQNNQESLQDFHDHVIVKQKLHRFYELASERIEKNLVKIPWPQPGSSSTSNLYRGYSTVPNATSNNAEDRLVTLKDEVKKAGMYGYKAWKPYSQYCFFWSDGSGVHFFSGVFVLSAMMLVAASQLHKAPEVWSVMAIAPIAGIFLFLVSQSMPAFVVFLADINKPNPDWRPWFVQILTFMRVLVTEGLPLMSLDQQPPWYVAVLHGFEGLELVSYVAVYALARLIGLGLLFCILNLARKMKVGIALHWVWSKLEPDLAFYSAKIAAPDVIRVKSAIIQAEFALDTRIQPCAASVHVDGINRPCTRLVDVKVLLEDLDKALLGEQNNAGFDTEKLHITNREERKQAIAAGLYTSTAEKLKDIEFPVDIAALLRPILSLLHRLHLQKPTYEALRVVDMLESHSNNLWIRRCSSSCLNEHEVKLMNVQLQASMLLYHFDEPSITHSLTGVTLHEWLEIRRLVPGIEFCDFIAL